MNNKIRFILFLLAFMLIIPFSVRAETKKYNTLTFREALAEEEIEEAFDNYKETDDQITIYLFRGKGCGYCRAFLTFMNNITEEYGKYFKMVTYEVWNDSDNSALMSEVSKYMGEEARGVPYIIIGDKVFGGYASTYDEEIKKAIVDLYNTKKKNRYDVFVQMKKNPNKDGSSSLGNNAVWVMIIANLALVTVLYFLIVSHVNNKVNELKKAIEEVNHTKISDKQNNKVEEKDSKNDNKSKNKSKK